VAVHDVEVQKVAPAAIDVGDFLAELGKIGGKDRRGDLR
jgi:hypothetical protein